MVLALTWLASVENAYLHTYIVPCCLSKSTAHALPDECRSDSDNQPPPQIKMTCRRQWATKKREYPSWFPCDWCSPFPKSQLVITNMSSWAEKRSPAYDTVYDTLPIVNPPPPWRYG